MDSSKNTQEDWLQNIKTERDEIRVRMHLAAADLHDEWEELEKRWEHLKSKSRDVGEAASESAEDVGVALELLAEELKAGYRRIRQRMH
ncbi:hypothetical protein [Litorivivens sp.]|uniref:hypothetical protein n=1 Tax=Litorivivens sp. TaxID=2020868 RepID=UPI0035632D2C